MISYPYALRLSVLMASFVIAPHITADGEEVTEAPEILEPITVTAQRVANLQPASTYASTATALRYDPQIDLQARGLPEGQADITVRGGLFENTGFRLGAVAVFDPQTGHYAVEIPIDPALLSSPGLLTDVDHGVRAFNSTVATIGFGFATIQPGGSLAAGFGTDSLRYASLRLRGLRELEGGSHVGTILAAAGSKGDGTLPNGDHDYKRFSGLLQYADAVSETNLVLGYHDKFYGWPGAYTGFASLPETDHTKLGLAVLDHRRRFNRGWWEAGVAYRWLEDDYDFDRRTTECCMPGSFDHKTRNFALGVAGELRAGGLDWNFAGQLAADRLVRSTDLTNGHFNSRTYLTLSLAPSREWALESGGLFSLQAGLRADITNRDEDALLPLFGVALEQQAGDGINRFELDLSRTSQVPGYTALNSPPQGLFGGNPDLEREYANTVTFSALHENPAWELRGSLFYRQDEDLVDWTFLSGAPFARQANPVDLDVTGVEGFVRWHSATLDIFAGYTWLHKKADYGTAAVDASYYALNYAIHRATLALLYKPLEQLEFRLDSEYRLQARNILRTGSRRAFIAALSVSWQPEFIPRTRINLIADNVTDDAFEEFPGTPAMGRQLSLGLAIDW